MTNDRKLTLNWVRNHEKHLHIWWQEIVAAIEASRLFDTAHLWTPEDREPCAQFVQEKMLDFHPKATRSERYKAIALLHRAYIEQRQFKQQKLFPV